MACERGTQEHATLCGPRLSLGKLYRGNNVGLPVAYGMVKRGVWRQINGLLDINIQILQFICIVIHFHALIMRVLELVKHEVLDDKATRLPVKPISAISSTPGWRTTMLMNPPGGLESSTAFLLLNNNHNVYTMIQ